TAGHIEVGLEQGALGYAPIRNSAFSVPEREHLIKQVHIFEQQIISGKIRVPSTLEELNAMNISQGISSKGAAPLAAPVLQTAAKPQEEGTTTQGEGTAAAAPAQEAPAAIEPAVEPAAQE
ncbi:MAG: hypothetical protein LBM75_10350, partial [Myxococcales bacterium]|nr:hypothetical protein [Myxococcales bacterium]